MGAAEQLCPQRIGGQGGEGGVGLVVPAAVLQQQGAAVADEQGGRIVGGGGRQAQGQVPVAGGGGDPRLDIEAGPGVRLLDRGGPQFGQAGGRIVVHKGLDHRDQPSGLADHGRHTLARRPQASGQVKVTGQQGRGEGLQPHGRLFGGQGLDPGVEIGPGFAEPAGLGQTPGQIQAIGRAAVGIGRHRGPDRRNGHNLRLDRRVRLRVTVERVSLDRVSRRVGINDPGRISRRRVLGRGGSGKGPDGNEGQEGETKTEDIHGSKP